MNNVKIAQIQMKVLMNKKDNILKAKKMIEKVSDSNPDFVMLPEMFNTPYDNKYFDEFSEEYPKGETINFLSEIAKKHKIYIIGGSIPEKENGKIYNTSFVFDRKGKLLGKHRKMHLFDIDVPGQIRFMESEVLTSGNKITILNTEFGNIGIIVCYDIRFPELIELLALNDAKMIFMPGAFNMTTGPAHWELLFRSRALDNQIFMIGTAPARDEDFSYVSYGNSLITNPWGEIVNKLDEKENILFTDVNLQSIIQHRQSIPHFKHRRTDIYDLRIL